MSYGKGPIFSDTRADQHGFADDALSNQGVEGLDTVVSLQVRDGLIFDFNCSNCGRQEKALTVWPEMVQYVRGVRLAETRTSASGVVYFAPCRCGKRTKVLMTWIDIRDALMTGVHAGKVPPQVARLLSGG